MTKTLKLAIDGMHCGGCVTRVTNALKKVDGVEVKDVQVGSAEISYNEVRVQPPAIIDSIIKIGFAAREV